MGDVTGPSEISIDLNIKNNSQQWEKKSDNLHYTKQNVASEIISQHLTPAVKRDEPPNAWFETSHIVSKEQERREYICNSCNFFVVVESYGLGDSERKCQLCQKLMQTKLILNRKPNVSILEYEKPSSEKVMFSQSHQNYNNECQNYKETTKSYSKPQIHQNYNSKNYKDTMKRKSRPRNSNKLALTRFMVEQEQLSVQKGYHTYSRTKNNRKSLDTNLYEHDKNGNNREECGTITQSTVSDGVWVAVPSTTTHIDLPDSQLDNTKETLTNVSSSCEKEEGCTRSSSAPDINLDIGSVVDFVTPYSGNVPFEFISKVKLSNDAQSGRNCRKHKCDECGRKYKFMHALHRHKKTHGKYIYCCQHCAFKSEQYSKLRIHKLSHTALLKPSCTPQSDSNGAALEQRGEHIESATLESSDNKSEELSDDWIEDDGSNYVPSDEDDDEDIPLEDEDDAAPPSPSATARSVRREGRPLQRHTVKPSYNCDVCVYTALDSKQLDDHYHNLHADVLDKYTCTECDFKTYKKHKWYAHLRKHPITYKCEVADCGKLLKSNHGLQAHMNSHAGIKPYQCSRCNFRATTSSAVTNHALCHEDYDRYQCDECGKKFKRIPTLLRHKESHKDTYHHQCDQCSFRTRQFSNLKIHRRIHTGYKPYLCHDCGYQTCYPALLKNHNCGNIKPTHNKTKYP